MTIEEAIYAKLLADAGVAARIGTRLYPAQAPQRATFPLGIYNEATQRSVYTMAGVLNLGLWSMRLEFYGDSYADAKLSRNAARSALDGFRGDIGSGTVTVRGVFNESGDDGVEVPIHADEFGIFRAGLDLAVHHGTT